MILAGALDRHGECDPLRKPLELPRELPASIERGNLSFMAAAATQVELGIHHLARKAAVGDLLAVVIVHLCGCDGSALLTDRLKGIPVCRTVGIGDFLVNAAHLVRV